MHISANVLNALCVQRRLYNITVRQWCSNYMYLILCKTSGLSDHYMATLLHNETLWVKRLTLNINIATLLFWNNAYRNEKKHNKTLPELNLWKNFVHLKINSNMQQKRKARLLQSLQSYKEKTI